MEIRDKLFLWMITAVVSVVALLGIMMIPGKKKIDKDEGLETYEGSGKTFVYMIGIAVIGVAGYLLFQYFVSKPAEASDLWFQLDMVLFAALGLGIIAYNAYSIKLISELEFDDVAEVGEVVEAVETIKEGEKKVVKKKTVKKEKKKTVKKAVKKVETAECPACSADFEMGATECPNCGAEFDYGDDVSGKDVFDCPSCNATNAVGVVKCVDCGVEFDYD